MRAFLALPIPSDVVAYLKEAIGRLERRTEGVRWVKDEGIHITVKFLGEIEEAHGGDDAVGLGPDRREVQTLSRPLGRPRRLPFSEAQG